MLKQTLPSLALFLLTTFPILAATMDGKWKGRSYEADPKYGYCNVEFQIVQTDKKFEIGKREYQCETGKYFTFEPINTEIKPSPSSTPEFLLFSNGKEVGVLNDPTGLGSIHDNPTLGTSKIVFWANDETVTQLWWAEKVAGFKDDTLEIDLRRQTDKN